MNIVREKWDEIIHKLKIEYDILDVSFKTWILPLEVQKIKDSTVYIMVPLKAYVDVITKKYLLSLKVCIAEIIGEEYEIVLKNPVVASDIISAFIDNNDKFDIHLWISLDRDFFINVTDHNADKIIRYLFERYPY